MPHLTYAKDTLMQGSANSSISEAGRDMGAISENPVQLRKEEISLSFLFF